MKKIVGAAYLSIVAAALVWGAACSSTGGGGGTATGDAGVPSPGTGAAADAASDAGADSEPAPECTGARAACVACCDQAHPNGSTTFGDALLACSCSPPVGTDGMCQSECAATECDPNNDAGAKPGDACDLCQERALADGGACVTQVDKACTDPDCVAYADCIDACP